MKLVVPERGGGGGGVDIHCSCQIQDLCFEVIWCLSLL